MTEPPVRYQAGLEGVTAGHLRGGFWVGWPTPPTPAMHLAMLRGSEAVVLAMDPPSGNVVGFVNAIGDGVLAASIPCLEVLPAWQGRGIGTELLRRILERLEPRYMVDLVCDEDLVQFYRRLGLTPYRAMIRRDRHAITTAAQRFGGEATRDDDPPMEL